MLAHKYVNINFENQSDFEKNYKLNVPEGFNFAYDIIDEYAKTEPDKRAMIWTNLEGEEKHFTFKQFSELSNQAANAFKARGLKKGDKVLLILKRRYEYWICILALMKLGCVFIPATHQLALKDIVYRVNSSKAKAVICVDADHLIKDVYQAKQECESLEHIFSLGYHESFINLHDAMAEQSTVFEKPSDYAKNEDLLLIYFTSGTTGMPKMATHNHNHPLAHIATAAYWHNVKDNDIHIAVADTGWAKAGWGKIYGQWIMGATLFVYDFDNFVPANLLAMISKYKVTSFCAPPTVYRFLIMEDLSQYDLSSLRWANTAGEPLSPEIYNKFLEYTGIRIFEGFGQSETTPLIMTSKYMNPRQGSTGRPSPAYDIDIVDAEGNSVEDGVEGEIVIRLDKGYPPGLFVGYLDNEEANKKVFYNNMYHTGDIAWRDIDGYFFFVGRDDDVIKSSGYRIGPFEVESALLEHPAVLECAITAVPHPMRGQVVKASIVLTKNYSPSDALIKELQNHVKKVTAPYKYPRIVEFVDSLPKTISGKIQRNLIRNSSK
ncbi:MAG: AMP-binding protein [Christensenellaceae bacterium]|nr:AMP-binding protein [Christensenellaceae bacterium]